ncbi:hypothetical protein RFF05_07965 [Bengtsoniella intestinalis]|uniref:hypothetical protein n=1 Tax=Bengtsoniella intestinalis TaxID=3073143 RepID=UPI00391FA998
MTYVNWLSMHALNILKTFHGRDCNHALLEEYATHTIDDDVYYDLMTDALLAIFAHTHHHFDENDEFDVWVFMDPIIKEFVDLCGAYELQRNLTENTNPYRETMLKALHKGLRWNSYCYDYNWHLSSTDRGQMRLLLFYSAEFMVDSEVIHGLLNIYDEFHKQVTLLKEALVPPQNSNIIPFPLVSTNLQEVA